MTLGTKMFVFIALLTIATVLAIPAKTATTTKKPAATKAAAKKVTTAPPKKLPTIPAKVDKKKVEELAKGIPQTAENKKIIDAAKGVDVSKLPSDQKGLEDMVKGKKLPDGLPPGLSAADIPKEMPKELPKGVTLPPGMSAADLENLKKLSG